MAEMFLPLEDAAVLEGVNYFTLAQRIKRNPDQYQTDKQQNPNGGKPLVMVALSSLNREARRKYAAMARKNGGEAMPKAKSPDQEPWYLDMDNTWYIENNKQQYYQAVELGNQIQRFLAYDEGERTAYAYELAQQLGMSQRSLYRYAEKYQEGEAWARKLEAENGHNYDYLKVLALCRKPKGSNTFPSLPPEQRAYIENILFDDGFAQNQGTVEMLYEWFEAEAKRQGWKYPSYQTVARYVKHFLEDKGNRNAHKLVEKGLKEYKRTVMIKGIRDTSCIPVMAIIQGDAHKLDFWVKYTDPVNGKVSAIRPELVAWIDVRSRVVMGAVMVKKSNAHVVKHSLLKVSMTYGTPECVHTDNGKDFTAQEITGRNRKERTRPDEAEFLLDAEAKGFLRSLGVKDDYRSLPYQSWGKGIVERFFLTVCNQFSKWFLSYTGTLTGARTAAKVEKDIQKMLENDTLITLEECSEYFEMFLDRYHNKAHGGLKSMGEQWVKPIELFQNAPEQYIKAGPEPRYAEMLLGKTEQARVYQTGIKRFGKWFMHSDLAIHIHSTVKVRWNPEDMSKLTVYTLDGKYVCDAPWQPLLHYHGYGSLEEVATHKQRQNGQLKQDRERVKQARMTHEERRGAAPIAGKIDLTVQNRQSQQVIALPEDRQYREEVKAKSPRRKKQPGSDFYSKKAEEALAELRKLG